MSEQEKQARQDGLLLSDGILIWIRTCNELATNLQPTCNQLMTGSKAFATGQSEEE